MESNKKRVLICGFGNNDDLMYYRDQLPGNCMVKIIVWPMQKQYILVIDESQLKGLLEYPDIKDNMIGDANQLKYAEVEGPLNSHDYASILEI